MARLYEFQGKQLLRDAGIAIPQGELGANPEECYEIACHIGGDVAVKAQVWLTDRKRKGGVLLARSPGEARASAVAILSRFPHSKLLVERSIDIAREFYVGVIVDDRRHQPVLLISAEGGSGIENRESSVQRLYLGESHEPSAFEMRALASSASVPLEVVEIGVQAWKIARRSEASSLEINPLVLTTDGEFVALDCRISIDDYAVYRHPELNIDIAREYSGTPTELDRIAWNVERNDYRGTFYFAELERSSGTSIGFHGCGGGGAMAAMDVVGQLGLRTANFADTSGNPAASKVYRAAKIILSQAGLKGYFLCGSGVASQEQIHLARGLIKAFREDKVNIPVVLRLGGNGEEEARREMLQYAAEASGPVEAYQKIHSTEFCGERLQKLIATDRPARPSLSTHTVKQPSSNAYSFATRTGQITYDHEICKICESKACVHECGPGILLLQDGLPRLAISEDDAARGRCTECLACEVACWYQGAGGASIDLPIAGLNEYREKHGHSC